jgi:protocatechuate 3,4-dioxygenase beta subunit
MHVRLFPLVLVVAALSLTLDAQVVIQSQPGTPVPQGPRTGPRDPSKPAETGTAVIRGRVVGGDSGQPLRRAIVRVGGEGMPEGRITTTDEHGRYEIKELPAGRLGIMAMKAGYVTMQYGQRQPMQPGKPLEIADGQVLQGVDFNLPRGGVIAGRITDEFGEPLPDVSVKVMRHQYVEGRRQLVPVMSGGWTRTDDLGRFRAYGLPAGDYYVNAAIEGGMFWGAQSDTRSGFAPTFYPGTPSASEAQRVRVTAGAENSSVHFALVPARTVEITGTVTDSQGQPLRAGFIMVQDGPMGSMTFTMRGGGQIKPDGTFRIGNLSPGEYVLHVNTATGPTDMDGESASVPVSVGAEDLDGLSIVTSRMAFVSGQVVSETGAAPTGRSAEFSFWAAPAEPGMMMRGSNIVTKDDWTFEGRLPTDAPVLIRPGRFPDGWALKAVLHDGIDVTDTGFHLRSGQDAHGVQLVVTNRISLVAGSVQDDRGAAARDYVVVVFVDDPGRWNARSRHIGTGRPDQQGRFEIKRLPAGHYLAVALDSIDEGQQGDPDFLETLRAYATPFQLGDGEQKTLALRMLQGR